MWLFLGGEWLWMGSELDEEEDSVRFVPKNRGNHVFSLSG